MDSSKNPYTYQYHYSPHNQSPIPSPRPKRSRRLVVGRILAIVILLSAISGAAVIFDKKARADDKPKVALIKPATSVRTKTNIEPTPTAESIAAAKIATMGSTINSLITNSGLDVSVSLVDLSNNQPEQYGDSSSFTAASTTKIITAAAFLHQVENGQQDLNENIDGFGAQYELQQMIVVSDDNAWDNINNLIGYPQIQDYAHSIGANSFQSVANTVTSNDMALVLQKLYEGQLLNSSNTQYLLSLMEQANYRQYIVSAVPTTDTVYHKVGFYGDDLHDEAIITDGSKSFVIVIFTSGESSDYDRVPLMQQITQAALNAYF